MKNIMFIYDNAIDSGALSGGNWPVPLANLKDPRPTKYARSLDLNPANAQFNVSLPASRTFEGIFFSATNLNQSGLVRIRAFSDALFTAQTFTTGWIVVGAARQVLEWGHPYFWTGRVPRYDPDRVGLSFPVLFGQSVTARYFLIEFSNPANADGAIKVGRAFMGTTLTPAINFLEGSQFGNATKTKVKEALSGTPYFKRRRRFSQFTASFPVASTQEAWNDWHTLIELCNLDKQIVVIPQPDDTDNIKKKSFLGRLEELPSFSFHVGAVVHQTSIKVTEYV